LDWNAPYNVDFVVPPATVSSTNCNLRFHGNSSGDQPITNFPTGRLSHFDNSCMAPPVPVMTPGISYGEEKRTPTAADVNVIIDIGYQSTGIYADVTSPNYSNTLPFGAPGVIGRTDGATPFNAACTNVYNIELCPETDELTINNFLVNDINADTYVGLELLEGSITNLQQGPGNQFTFTATAAGQVTFRYIPVDAAGNLGNITCVYINVTPCLQNCLIPDPCNLVCNPSMDCPDGNC
ncbi:unnamed protein product, partial [marine sediment metagenome]